MENVPLTILTIFHPEHWLGIPASELDSLPHIRRSRKEIEEARINYAKNRGFELTTEKFNNRQISNLGKPVNALRKTWINKVLDISLCVTDLKVRLNIYDEEGTQSKFRLECRYDWGNDENNLDKKFIDRMRSKIMDDKKLSIRQLWINSNITRAGKLPLPKVIDDVPEYANLIVGPYESGEALREGRLSLLKKNGVWWVRY